MIKFLNVYIKVMLLIILVELHFNVSSQNNLVPNPSFEQYDTCPYFPNPSAIGLEQICKSVPWFQPNEPNATPSSGCGNSSSDFFHSCSGQIPNVLYTDFQFPNFGNGFSGIATYDALWIPEEAREYLEIKLIENLKNHKYCVSWYANLSSISRFGSNHVGALFTKDTVFQYGFWEIIPTIPQIENLAIVTDTQNWVPFHQTFTAEGGEKYMTVGNFRVKSLIETGPVRANNNRWVYYYFDDFGVYELPEISAGMGGEIDTLGESVSLQANCEGCWNDLVYRWWPSAGLSDTTILNPIATPEVTTTYYFGLIDTSETVPCIVDLMDSVTVFVTIPQDTVTAPPTSFSWLVYPSPTNGNLTVQFSGLSSDSQLLLIDARGRLVRKIAVPKNTESLPLDISALAAGEYFLQVENSNLKERRKVTKF
ncbi:MAG: T9SS type A sorting domain-containing protein [Flavobacteriales bacterium]|nr:T9SS type A sorting domain-containing protein [Flavobacteriales bacterium]